MIPAGMVPLRDFTRGMGVAHWTADKWRRKGALRLHRYSYGKNPARPLWALGEEDVLAFLADERFWHNWSPDHVRVWRWKEAAIVARKGVRLVPLRRAAVTLGYSWLYVADLARRGRLTVQRDGWNQPYYVRTDVLDAFAREWPRQLALAIADANKRGVATRLARRGKLN